MYSGAFGPSFYHFQLKFPLTVDKQKSEADFREDLCIAKFAKCHYVPCRLGYCIALPFTGRRVANKSYGKMGCKNRVKGFPRRCGFQQDIVNQAVFTGSGITLKNLKLVFADLQEFILGVYHHIVP